MKSDVVNFRILNGKKSTYYFRQDLNQEGFTFNKKAYGKSFWEKKLLREDQESIDKLQEFCKEKKLKFELIYPEFFRSNDYRKIFFHRKKGIFDSHLYFCSYCGFIFNQDNITVDHIIPIDKVYNNKFYQWILKKFKIENINDYNNLTAACKRCNSKKARKVGLLTIRGFLGKYNIWWFILWTCFLIISFILIKEILNFDFSKFIIYIRKIILK